MSKVKAAVMKNFGKLEIVEFPYPEIDERSMVVKMVMVGICGTDKHLFAGKDKNAPLPMILGHENLAKVEKIGDKARAEFEVNGRTLSQGDRIFWFPAIPCGKCWYCKWLPGHPAVLCPEAFAYGLSSCEEPPYLFGGYAEKVYIKPGTWVWKVPDDLPDEVVIFVDSFAAANGVIRAMNPHPIVKEGFGPTDVVAVQGSGAIGFAAAMTAKMSGAAEIILLGGPEHRLKLAENFGIFDHIINIDEVKTPKERVKLVKELTPGKVGPDLVVECTGVPSAVPEGLEMVRRGGTFVEIGSFVNTGETKISPFKHLCWQDIRLIGQYGCSPQYYEASLRLVRMAWERGWPLDRLVTDKFPLEEAQSAMESAGRLKGIKTVLVM